MVAPSGCVRITTAVGRNWRATNHATTSKSTAAAATAIRVRFSGGFGAAALGGSGGAGGGTRSGLVVDGAGGVTTGSEASDVGAWNITVAPRSPPLPIEGSTGGAPGVSGGGLAGVAAGSCVSKVVD